VDAMKPVLNARERLMQSNMSALLGLFLFILL
jgi:hypothetical protein